MRHVVPEDKSTHEAGSKVVTYTGYVHGVDCDLFGHLNTARYGAIFDSATWRMLGVLGYRWQPGGTIGWADVKNTITYEGEVPVDSDVQVVSRVSRVGDKSVTLVHELAVDGHAQRAATIEAVLVQFDLRERKAVRVLDDFRREALKYVVTTESHPTSGVTGNSAT